MKKQSIVLVFALLTFFVSCNNGVENSNAKSDLKVARIFGSSMVLQRNTEIPVYGTANSGSKIQVEFNGDKVDVETKTDGKWKAKLPVQKAGGPYQLTISASDTVVKYTDILVGEVWLASGQSNMHLDMSRTLNGKENAKKADNTNIRIMYFQPTFPTGANGVHTDEEIVKINNNKYFNYKGWNKVDSVSVKNFSAVAYYFAEKLQKNLNVPIGIIHNAVPGAPIESWLNKKIIDGDKLIKEYGDKRWSDTTDVMVNIGKNQVKIKKSAGFKLDSTANSHSWMPAYNYTNGIEPIKDFGIAGVIWYQGESNAEDFDFYPHMFTKLVDSWRKDFNDDFPFYYVQLTSRNDRPTWPDFRNMQRVTLNSISNSGMVVISDVGDKNDTHAKNKKPVGERLATLALGKDYNIGDNYESPMFDKVSEASNNLIIHFKGKFKDLKTSDGKSVSGFEVSENGVDYKNVSAKIKGNTIVIKNNKKSKYIRYAWKSYTEANLVSGSGLPVSTFVSE
ncbi:MAG: hypothetical protein KAG96_00645 [Ichthyobacteriaceae bacterium]|nr:hypothetical protein [Ichthyobacteriaceae bacterium]